jgi:hypothetical protein
MTGRSEARIRSGMPNPKPKPKPKLKPKPKPKPVSGRAKLDHMPATGQPFMRFFHTPILRKKTLVVLERLETAPDPTQHRMALADVVVELTRAGMDAYFMEPLRTSKAGFITEQSAGLGMAGAVQVITSVMRNIIGGMGAPQLRSVGQSIRLFMR